MRIMPRLEAKFPAIHRSLPTPGENRALDSGV